MAKSSSIMSDERHQAEEKNIYEQVLSNKSLKPGFVRFNVTYFSKDKDAEFVIQSLEWVSQYGYLLVPPLPLGSLPSVSYYKG